MTVRSFSEGDKWRQNLDREIIWRTSKQEVWYGSREAKIEMKFSKLDCEVGRSTEMAHNRVKWWVWYAFGCYYQRRYGVNTILQKFYVYPYQQPLNKWHVSKTLFIVPTDACQPVVQGCGEPHACTTGWYAAKTLTASIPTSTEKTFCSFS